MAGIRHVSGVLFTMIVRWQGDRQVSGVLFSTGSEMAGVSHAPRVLFSMIVRWHMAGMCQECCSLW